MTVVVERRKKAIWGVVLIALGVVFLLDQFEILELRGIGHWWPAFLILIGLTRIVTLENPRHIASGIGFVLWGLWFFACMQHWYGLTYRTAWPLILVIIGFEAVLMAFIGRAGKGEQHV